jgi:hypothetical protein
MAALASQYQISDCSEISRASSTSMPRYLAELDRADRDRATVLPERVARLREKFAKIKE